MKGIKYVSLPEVHEFTGGAIGYISYDCVRYFEPRTTRSTPDLKDTLQIPDSVLMFCDTVIVFDHLYQTLRVISHVLMSEHSSVEKAYESARTKILKTIERLNDTSPCNPEQGLITLGHESVSNVGKSGYEGFVNDLKKYINEGDIIQAVSWTLSICSSNMGILTLDDSRYPHKD
jgi:anthranilate synthase component 1